MELLSTLILFSFFSFLYHLGWSEEDFILELSGGIGFFLLGIVIWSTGLQLSAIVANGSSTSLAFQSIPSSGAFGIVLALFSAVLLIYAGNTIIKTRSKIDEV